MNEVKAFKIGEREFEIRTLVLGQIQKITKLAKEVSPTSQGNLGEELISELLASGRFSEFLAILLTPKNEEIGKKNIAEIALHLENNLELSLMEEITKSFFEVIGGGKSQEKNTQSMETSNSEQ